MARITVVRTVCFGSQAVAQTISSERQLSGGDLNRSMQHLPSSLGEGDVENEAAS